jgi:hypothetical protein
MGNGPSLNQMNLDLFKNEYVWGSNRCYLLFDRINWRPSFYVSVDRRVVPDNAQDINELMTKLPRTLFFLPSHFLNLTEIKSHKNLYRFVESLNKENNNPFDSISLDPSKSIPNPKTVTITAIQLAAYLGFNPIYLIGCDTSYIIPSNVTFENGVSDFLISNENNDPNHFSTEYFGSGKKWHDPHVDRMFKQYEEANIVYKSIGLDIYNATVGGKLEVFPRVNYLDLF